MRIGRIKIPNKILVPAIIFAAVFAVYWPILIGGQVIIGKWALIDQYPRLAFIQRSLANHQSVIWTENFLAGFPIYLGAWGEHVQPITLLLLKFFNYITVSHWIIFFNSFLGGYFLFLLARNLSLSRTASLIAALVFSLNQWNLFYSPYLFWGNVFPLLPLIFLSILKISFGKKKYIAVLITALALGWLSVMPDIMLYTTIASFSFAIYADYRFNRDEEKWYQKIKVTRYFILGFLVAVILASPRLLPAIDFLKSSVRSSGVKEVSGIFESAESNGYIGINSIIGIFFPYFYLIYSDFIPFFNGADKLTFLYIGFLPLSFLMLGFLNLKRIISEKPMAKYFFFLFAITIAMLVKYIPLFYFIHKLPIFKLFGGTGKYATISFFALAIFCGFSFDCLHWIKQKNLSKFLNFYKYFLVIFTAISAAVTFVFYVFKNRILSFAENYFVKNLYESSKQRPMEHYRKLIQETYDGIAHNFSLNNTHYLLSFVFIFLSYFVLRAFQKDKISPQKFKILALIVIVLNLTFVWQGYFNVAPRSIIIDIPEDIKFINSNKTAEKPFRVFRFWGGLSEYVDMGLNQYDEKEKISLEIAMLAPNYSLLHDIQFIGGHENIMSARQSKIMAFIGSERAPKDKTWAQDQKTSTEDKVARFESPANRSLLSMLNVRYIVTSFDFKRPWKKVFETRVTKYNLPVYIYENPAFLPRIYLAKNVKFIASDNQKSFDELLKISDFKNNTLIECSDNDCSGYKNYYDPGDLVEIQEIKSGYLKVKTSTKYPRWLVYSESNLPTWEVRLNNNPELIPIRTANYLFQAVYIPPGDNTITFTYPGIWGQMKYSAESQLSKLLTIPVK